MLFYIVATDIPDRLGADGTTWHYLQRRNFATDIGWFPYSYGVRIVATEEAKVILQATLTCPNCGHAEIETIPCPPIQAGKSCCE